MQNFLLVGGTALALQMGHRTSTDIDLFWHQKFDTQTLRNEIENDFDCEIKSVYRFAVFSYIENIKVDIVFQKSNLLNDAVVVDGVKMASLNDLAAMKLMAITNRGKLRDFVDIYMLLQKFKLEEMLEMWSSKFENSNYELVVRSLTYFEDAIDEGNMKWFFPFNWKKIQGTLIREVRKIKP
jgi:predicted nucleotidyltransferase component of viral defense system